MDNSGRFHNALVEFNRRRKYAKIKKGPAFGLIQFGKCLPRRLDAAVEKTKEDTLF